MNSRGNQPFSIEAAVAAAVVLFAAGFFLVTHDNAVRPPSELWPKIFHWVASHYVPYRETHPLPPVPTLPPAPWYVYYVYPVLGWSLFALGLLLLLLDWRQRKEDPEASIMDPILESILGWFRKGKKAGWGGESVLSRITRDVEKEFGKGQIVSEMKRLEFVDKLERKYGSETLGDSRIKRILKRYGFPVD